MGYLGRDRWCTFGGDRNYHLATRSARLGGGSLCLCFGSVGFGREFGSVGVGLSCSLAPLGKVDVRPGRFGLSLGDGAGGSLRLALALSDGLAEHSSDDRDPRNSQQPGLLLAGPGGLESTPFGEKEEPEYMMA